MLSASNETKSKGAPRFFYHKKKQCIRYSMWQAASKIICALKYRLHYIQTNRTTEVLNYSLLINQKYSEFHDSWHLLTLYFFMLFISFWSFFLSFVLLVKPWCNTIRFLPLVLSKLVFLVSGAHGVQPPNQLHYGYLVRRLRGLRGEILSEN